MNQKINPSQIIQLTILAKGYEMIQEDFSKKQKPSYESSDSNQFWYQILNSVVDQLIRTSSMNYKDQASFWQSVKEHLDFNTCIEFLVIEKDQKYKDFIEEVQQQLEEFYQISEFHQYLFNALEFISNLLKMKKDDEICKDEGRHPEKDELIFFKKGSIVDLFARGMHLKLRKMSFKEVLDLQRIFLRYINGENKESDFPYLITENHLFVIENQKKVNYEQNQEYSENYILDTIYQLDIAQSMKQAFKEYLANKQNLYLQSLQMISTKKFNELELEKMLHNFIDAKFDIYIPEKNKFQNAKELEIEILKLKDKEQIQKAVLLKACQKLMIGNIQEALSIVYDSIRIAQTNQDNDSINLGLIYLSLIYINQEKFSLVFRTLREFFSLSLAEKDPLVILQGCLLYLKLEKEYTPLILNSESSNLKNSSLQMSLVETIQRTLKDIMLQQSKKYFEKSCRYFWQENDYQVIIRFLYQNYFFIYSEYYQSYRQIQSTIIDYTLPCPGSQQQKFFFDHLLTLSDCDTDQIFTLIKESHNSYFLNNQTQRDLYIYILQIKFMIKRNQINQSKYIIDQLYRISKNIEDPNLKNQVVFLHFNILLQSRNFDKLSNELQQKLLQLNNHQYSKKIFFKFKLLLLKILYEKKDYQELLQQIEDDLQILQKENITDLFFEFSMLQVKVFYQTGQFHKMADILNSIDINILRANSEVQSNYYFLKGLQQIEINKLDKSPISPISYFEISLQKALKSGNLLNMVKALTYQSMLSTDHELYLSKIQKLNYLKNQVQKIFLKGLMRDEYWIVAMKWESNIYNMMRDILNNQ